MFMATKKTEISDLFEKYQEWVAPLVEVEKMKQGTMKK